ncbi:AMP-binding protein [Paraburkholderia bengalensis]|uniref:AMP-binding protein n=1 Tax=Paraburkholderia bengalensis TaxID=2747562 RepID=A0ABU8ILD4_9BURK
MNIANWLADASDRWPTNPALLHGEVLVADYVGFRASARHTARLLVQRHGIQPGDRIAIFMNNTTNYLVLLYGIWWCGGIAVPINSKLHPAEAAEIVCDAEAQLVFTEDGVRFQEGTLPSGCTELSQEAIATLISSAGNNDFLKRPLLRSSDDLAWLFYTSGTTGRSKGVMLSHGNLTAMALCYAIDVQPITQDDAILYAAPMSHGAGLYNFVFVRSGAAHVVPESCGFDPNEVLRVSAAVRNISFFAAPTMIKRLVDAAERDGLRGDGIRSVIIGGAPMYVADLDRAIEILGPRFIQIYGQGESPMTITSVPKDAINDRSRPDWNRIASSVGYAQSCIELRVLSDDWVPVAPGVRGEVMVRGATVMQGYWHNEQATNETIVNGWLRTGDIGYLDPDGLLTLTDRSKDVVISGGSNIYPREVEEILASHPSVKEVAVTGQPDSEWGEVVVAFVVVQKAAYLSEATLTKWFVDRMASFKKPKRYVFLDELPKNGYGKVAKTALRALLAPAEAAEPDIRAHADRIN